MNTVGEMASTTALPRLSLANGTDWVLCAGNESAAPIVAQLSAAMELRAATGPGRELIAVVDEHHPDLFRIPISRMGDSGPLTCVLSPPVDGDMLTIQAMLLSLAIALDAQARGGLLIHGALAAWQKPGFSHGQGILLVGPGTVGKTTASRRLPPPWRSLCDDTALVVRDAHGRYWAHPWPTWSRFYDNGPGGSWPVERAVPLLAIFFLGQSVEDQVTPVNETQATAMLVASTQQVAGSMSRRLSADQVRALHREQFDAASALAHVIPAFTLHISLEGAFWHEIERTISALGPPPSDLEAVLGHSVQCVAYYGPSMNPTLAEPDLLEVEAYGDRVPRCGDIVHFLPPAGDRALVHRIVAVTAEGIRTRGDNNPQDDADLVPHAAISGRVVAAWRGQRRRRIAGGELGVFVGYLCRLWPPLALALSRSLHEAYHALSATGLFCRLLPPTLRPRVVLFRGRHQGMLKLMIGRREVGQYDHRTQKWRIGRPFRLFVDVALLPDPLSVATGDDMVTPECISYTSSTADRL